MVSKDYIAMRLRILLFICVFLTQAGCSKVYIHRAPPPKICALSSFSAIEVSGNIDLNLHTGYNRSKVSLLGDPRELNNVRLNVIDGVLHLSVIDPSQQKGPIFANIETRYLNGFAYHGRGTITANNIKANFERLIIDNDGTTTLKGVVLLSYVKVRGAGYTEIQGVVGSRLHVQLAGSAKLKLTGMAGVHRLTMKGSSWFSLSWVKTPAMIVRLSDNAYAELAGIVNKLDVDLVGRAKLNAKYLRARRAFVKTHDHSVAEIAVTKHQHTLATDASDIRFYNLPDMKTDFMNMNGAVLDMRAFNTQFVEEPTPYNI
jgi:hypothetical protein